MKQALAIGIVALTLLVGTQSVFAQTAPQAKPSATASVAPEPVAPQVGQQDQQTFQLMLLKAQVQAEMIQNMQKELDSTNAEVSRLIGRLQRDGFDIQRDQKTGSLTYVPKAEKK
jgi:uncharacterized protein (DUF305 family)